MIPVKSDSAISYFQNSLSHSFSSLTISWWLCFQGAKVTLVSRKAHWPTPRKIADLIPFQYVFLSRLGQALVTGHRGALPGAPAHMSWWHRLGWPVMAGAFTVVEMLFALQFRNMSGSTSPLFKCASAIFPRGQRSCSQSCLLPW